MSSWLRHDQINDSETTTVTFTNKKAPPTLIVCKWTKLADAPRPHLQLHRRPTALSAVAVASEADRRSAAIR